MRLFIAVEFPELIRQRLKSDTDILRPYISRGRFTRKDNYHLTLVFLGEVPERQVTGVRQAMDACTAAPFEMTIGQPGRFRGGDADILWREIRAPKVLYDLQQELSDRLRENGFRPDGKRFKPHLTLAREVILDREVSMNDLQDRFENIRFRAEKMTLMRSDRINGKLTYTPVYKRAFALDGQSGYNNIVVK